MIIECTNCHARYKYGEERFEGKPSKKIKCAKCQTIFEIHNPAMAPAEPSRPSDETLDSTSVGRAKRAFQPEPEAEPNQEGKPPNPDLLIPEGKRFSLAILDGPGAGSVFRLEKPATTIGRAQADIVIEDQEASRQHSSIEIRDYLVLLNDLGSTNGTMVNGEKITTATELQDKSEFQIGSTTFMLIVTSET